MSQYACPDCHTAGRLRWPDRRCPTCDGNGSLWFVSRDAFARFLQDRREIAEYAATPPPAKDGDEMTTPFEQCVAMPGQEWRDLSVRVSWLYRRGGVPSDWDIHPLTDRPTKEVWAEFRAAVTRARRKAYSTQRYAATAEKREARKAYMRDYMRRRRLTASVTHTTQERLPT